MQFIGRVTMLFANNSLMECLISDHHEIFTHFFRIYLRQQSISLFLSILPRILNYIEQRYHKMKRKCCNTMTLYMK